MVAAISVQNQSNIAFTIRNIELSVLQQDRRNANRMVPVAALRLEGVGDLKDQPAFNLGPFDPQRGPFIFKSSTIFPSLVEQYMREPQGLIYRVVNFDLTDEFGRNFVFSNQDVNDHTVGITIDYGDGETETYRVATHNLYDAEGKMRPITMQQALQMIGITRSADPTGDTPTADPNNAEIQASYGTQPDPGDGDLDNTVTADSVESAPDTDALAIPIAYNPALKVVKSSTAPAITANQVVTYTFLVTNVGNVTLSGITVTDPKCDAAPLYGSGDANTDSKLQVIETWTYTCDHTVTQTEIDAGGKLANTVTADSTESTPATDTHEIPITQSPALLVVKASTTTLIAKAGDVVPYSFTVTNPGNQTLTGISVTDANCDAAPVYVSGDANTDAKLQTSETWIYTCNHTVTQAEADSKGGGDGDLYNTVTADSIESAPDTDALAIPIAYNPALKVVKSSTAPAITANQVVTYTFLVTNVGNVTLSGITVTDPKCDAVPAVRFRRPA